jgi:hypothetical protein
MTYDIAAEWLSERVEGAAGMEEQWPASVRAGVSEAMRLLAANPDVAHLMRSRHCRRASRRGGAVRPASGVSRPRFEPLARRMPRCPATSRSCSSAG